jgi:hypothetical protein
MAARAFPKAARSRNRFTRRRAWRQTQLMKRLPLKFVLALGLLLSIVSGCASNSGGSTSGGAPANAVQSSTGPTVSGYVDVGASKGFH